ncbi:olfactory receptor 9K2-like [Heterocephalus glaber]|uniref:Olfactory receptor n=1 Tax=Heterocephalus glaber TaxID=10181 RepID=A0AAX6QHJ5_HETGA|nr:olfactory receptor 9K2-like [Heterocephalus glaber]
MLGSVLKIHLFILPCASHQVSSMGDRGTSNHSEMTDFILVGFRVRPELCIFIFLLFLLIYAMIILGNVGMVAIIMTDPRLNTPMYFFLGNLSFIDLFYSSVIAPKAMTIFLSESKSISFAGCVAQLFLFTLFIVTEGFLLAAMAYDRFIAICNPLLYSVQMSTRLCSQLVAGSYFCGSISSVLQTSMTFTLSFCASRAIDHFYCDTRPLQRLSCSDLLIHKVVSFSLSSIILLNTCVNILVSVVEETVSMGKSMGLDVDGADIEKLVEDLKKELMTEGLAELQSEQHKALVQGHSTKKKKTGRR